MPRSKAKAGREQLSPDRIETAALRVIEREGYEGYSARKLAAALGCEAMSIYHYFPSMAHLRDALLDRVVAAVPIPSPALPWIERLRAVAYGYRAMALAYPRFFQHIALHRMNTAVGLRFLEDILAIFRDAGFDDEAMARQFRVFSYYVSGAALDESAGYAKGPSAVVPVPGERLAREFPLVVAVNPWFRPQQHEATFALGLEMLLDGIRRAHDAARKTGRLRLPAAAATRVRKAATSRTG